MIPWHSRVSGSRWWSAVACGCTWPRYPRWRRALRRDRCKAAAIAHLVLQGCEEGLRNGVVVAISGAVAGKPRVVGARPFGERPVAVEHDVSWHVTVRFGRFRRHYDDVAGHAIRERAFDHHVGAQVDGGGQVEPALSGAQVGDVAHELVDGRGAREVAAQQVGARLRLFPGEKAVTFFRNAFSISSSRMCF